MFPCRRYGVPVAAVKLKGPCAKPRASSAAGRRRRRLQGGLKLDFELQLPRNRSLNSTGLKRLKRDCHGVAGGSAKYDRCRVCNGTNTCLDCAGVPNGKSRRDRCKCGPPLHAFSFSR